MNCTLRLGLFFLALLAAPKTLFAQKTLQPNDRIIVCSDLEQGLLYSTLLENYLLMCQQTPGVKILHEAMNEDRTQDLLARLATDVIPCKPSVVILPARFNDMFMRAMDDSLVADYLKNQTATVQALKAAGVRLIVLPSMPCFDTTHFHHDKPGEADAYNQVLEKMAKNSAELAKAEGAIYAPVFEDTMAAMTKAKADKGADFIFGVGDNNYPSANGLLVVTGTLLKSLGCDGAIGTLTVDMTSKQAQGTPGQKIVSFQDGTLTVESTRYPYYVAGDPDTKDGNAASILKDSTFSQDLNRYMLVVNGLATPNAKVTWGAGSKEFTKAELAKGINLAAEFVKENPFGPQANAVNVAVYTQEGRDNIVWKALHDLKAFDEVVGTGAPLLDKIFQDATKDISKYQKAAMDLVIPLSHTIKIEPSADAAAATTSTTKP